MDPKITVASSKQLSKPLSIDKLKMSISKSPSRMSNKAPSMTTRNLSRTVLVFDKNMSIISLTDKHEPLASWG